MLSCHRKLRLAQSQNSSLATVVRNFANKKTIYERKTPLEHVLLRPGMYVGQTEVSSTETWLYNESANKMEKRSVGISPALLKIFDEIIVNAADNQQRNGGMTKIDVEVGHKNGKLSVSICNDGKGIPVEKHETEDLYVPELIFGHLLTGSNFNDKESRLTGGSHGYGAKLTNMFSRKFRLETFDAERQLLFTQTWSANMTEVGTAKVEACSKTASYTKVSFEPDLERLGFSSSSSSGGGSADASTTLLCNLDDVVSMFRRRTMDIAACVAPQVKVRFNGSRVPVASFKDYVKLFAADSATTVFDSAELDLSSEAEPGASRDPVFYADVNSRWSVAAKQSSTGGFESMSFVNSVWTARGGTHVAHVTAQIVRAFEEALKKRAGGSAASAPQISSGAIRNKLMVFVNCSVENPSFDGQSKEMLNTKPALYGSECVLPAAFLRRLVRDSGIMESIQLDIALLERRKLAAATSKSAGRTVLEVPKLQDAHSAGGSRAAECTLILTEGDSAKALAVAGLEVVGRELFGVLPLRGKVLNVRVATKSTLTKNAEIINLCKALGLDFNRTYRKGVSGLRYGKVMLMCDQDTDGSHIKGLLINLFHHFWPALLEQEGFLQQFITPIVKAKLVRGGGTGGGATKPRKSPKAASKMPTASAPSSISFYSIPEYEAWRSGLAAAEAGRYSVKYYKGLGTNTAEEGKEYFRSLDKHRKTFYCGGAQDDAIDLAFSKSRAEDRKLWLTHLFDPSAFVDPHAPRVSYEEFVDKELIQFSAADNHRSLPCVVDGLKPSQRKVLHGCFKKNLREEAKVVQIAGYIAEHTAYHHGEASLHSTIINMAQDFVGSNNVPLLVPSGQFGTRAQGGKDFASPRYIFTRLSPITRYLFPTEDDRLLDYLEEDGQATEPRYFVPVIPTLLLNGSNGIGTGWSTNCPSYNLTDVVRRVEAQVRGVPFRGGALVPWTRGFTGSVKAARKLDAAGYTTSGVAMRTSKTTVEIRELPLGRWTDDYKEVLCAMAERGAIRNFTEHHATDTVCFVVSGTGAQLDALEKKGLVSAFSLETSISVGNMHAFDPSGAIVRYNSPEEVLATHFGVRLDLYQRRKAQLERTHTADELLARNKSRFIADIARGDISILSQGSGKVGAVSEAQLVAELARRNFPTMAHIEAVRSGGSASKQSPQELESLVVAGSAEGASESSPRGRHGFEYLLDQSIHSLTGDRSAALARAASDAGERLRQCQARSAEDLWVADLGGLEAKYAELYGKK